MINNLQDDNKITKYFEKYVQNILKIPYCNFEGLNPKIAYEIVIGLSLMYEMYPFFDRVICAINQKNDLESHVNILKILNDPKTFDYFELENDDKCIYALHSLTKGRNRFSNKNCLPYYSILIYDNIKKINISNINNLSETSYGRVGIYHEFGHLLDAFLNISDSDKLKNIIKNHNIEKEISDYACTDRRELVACAFSRYILSKKKLTNLEKALSKIKFSNTEYVANPLINEIGQLIDDEYNKFVKFKQIKYIKEKYNFNKKFTIKKDCECIDIKYLKDNVKKLKI